MPKRPLSQKLGRTLGLIAKVASYHSTILEIPERSRKTHFISQMFANEDCRAKCLILYTCGND